LATTRAIQRRIKSVQNISQVTRAMEMVAASSMRRAQRATLASRAYADRAREVLAYLAAQPGRSKLLHPLLEERSAAKRILLILITSDRGLCGAHNVNVIRTAFDFLRQFASGDSVKMITMGKYGREIAVRSGKTIVAEFTGLSDKPSILDIGPIAKIAIEEFVTGQVDRVDIAFTSFVNVLIQRPQIRPLLPLHAPSEPIAGASEVFLYEPDPETILASVLPRLTELQIYQALLESVASEHSARMIAMRNATENAHDLTEDLTLEMNKARQATITREMLDIVGGANALRESLTK
jgi:F-type H+-transporting ATPase subunit gamma